MTSRETLKELEVFKGLNEPEVESILDLVKEHKYKAGTRIFEEKSLASNLYLVLEGKVHIKMRGVTKEKQMIIDTIGPGEIFGWSAVTDPLTFTAAAWTAEDSTVLSMNADALRHIFKINNQIGYKVMTHIASVISKRLRQLSMKLSELMSEE